MNGKGRSVAFFAGVVLAGALAFAPRAHGYAVLSHEEVVDMAWTGQLLPLLQKRFPNLTPDQITEAHAYAYGGSVIQDIGYYPFGDKQFSDLLHYVRSGDFVSTLLRDASTPDELAFALGALAHYYGDTLGHPTVNAVTAEEYPVLEHRFGRIVTYGEDPTAHLRTEFGFDVVEVAHGNYSQQNYRDFIGFQVAKPLLERAFLETYGLPMNTVMKHEDLAISTYRYSVSKLIPHMTHVALAGYHQQIEAAYPGTTRRKFYYRMHRTEFEKAYGKQYSRPSFGAHFVAFLLQIVPKIGPFKALQLKLPNAAEQTQYLASMNAVEDAYRAEILTLTAALSVPYVAVADDSTQVTPANLPVSPQQAAASYPKIVNLDFDTGKPVAEGEYGLTDQTYAYLVNQLAHQMSAQPDPGARPQETIANIEAFYANPSATDAVKAKPQDWATVQANLSTLRHDQLTPAQPATSSPTATE